MSKPRRKGKDTSEVAELRARLRELEDTLRAIRGGEVDALLVSSPGGDRVFTLQGSEHPYRVLVEAMNEGAATLSDDGLVLYANARFAEMAGTPIQRLVGASMDNIICTPGYIGLRDLLQEAQRRPLKVECEWHLGDSKRLPVYLSLSPLREHSFEGIGVVATDLTSVKQKEKELAQANEKLRREVAQRLLAEQALRREEESLRQLSGRLLQLQDEERRRIARDLHDSTGQKLVALTLDLTLLESLKKDFPERAREALSECFRLAEEISSEVRTMSYLLHPPLLDEVGLACAVRWYIDGFQHRSKLEIELDLPAEIPRLSPELEIALFRILQETLTNVHRHSGSPTAHVSFSLEDDNIVLEVKDQGHSGKGQALTGNGGSVPKLGVGIRGMKERVRQLGGQLMTVWNSEGTCVTAVLPLYDAQHKGAPQVRYLNMA